MTISIILLGCCAALINVQASDLNGNIMQNYKVSSGIYFSAESKYYDYCEGMVVVESSALPSGKKRVEVSCDLFEKFSFISDSQTKNVLEVTAGSDAALCTGVCEVCSKCLSMAPKDNIGKTWQQDFELSDLGESIPCKVSFVVTAREFKSDTVGKIIAVRALSKDFDCALKDEKNRKLNARINSIYLFDESFETVYMGLSVFSASERVSILKRERLRHEIAVYMADESGEHVDLGLKNNPKTKKAFSSFMKKLELTNKVPPASKSEEVKLSKWVRQEALVTSKVSNICAAMACEGASNPVATIYMTINEIASIQTISNVGSAVVGSVGSAISSVVAPVSAGLGPAAPLVGAGTAVTVAEEHRNSKDSDKPATPTKP